ncbi:UNVERIFIED_CONTAM: hypothetical protein RMT77_018628 [Armadillidium vulgare]
MEDIATEVVKRKDIILKKKTQMTKNLDNCLQKLEELTMSQSERIDTVNARKILDEIDEDLKKTDDVVRSDDIKSSISILLSSFRNSEQFLLEIYKRLQNGEKVFAVHKLYEEFKYGEVSFFSKQLFFHSLSLSKVPKDSSLVWFEDVKQCLNYKNFCTFIKISSFMAPFVIIEIETFDQCFCNKFIKLCTGECGQSYKGSIFSKRYNNRDTCDDLTSVFQVKKYTENKSEKMRLMDCKHRYQNHQSVSFKENEMLLYLDLDVGFTIFRCNSAFNPYRKRNSTGVTYFFGFPLVHGPRAPDITCSPPIGRVISPLSLHKDINYKNCSDLILDCGILINL